ncbi:histone-lysine N-methyltransferase Smyd1 isoform X2 [Kryptolebias marmoratus]|uniref:[histone H3]-lysine(4) N-trimethyltransferase n=1 Tax=Kryptolebias marmoratus TaxID=37003 RepID=A0A3Q3EPI6_KRYMA|nr:histone-lysine N-methyltransferase Smyd1 isoform X2 [Kryptolebias marmoratus]
MTGGNMELFESEKKGRGLRATRELQTGEVVLAEPSYSAVVFDSLAYQVCHSCFRRQAKLHRCTQCRFAHYCDRTCQTACWEEHKQECAAIRTLGFPPNQNVRLAARMMWRRKKDQGLASDGQLVAADLLQDHLGDLPEEELKKLQSDVDNLLKFCSIAAKHHSVEDIRHIFGVIRCNRLPLTDQRGRQDVGWGVFPSLSLVNHDCWPNCAVTFNHGNQSAVSSALHSKMRMELRALRKISEGEELTFGYVDLLNLSADRQQQLKERFHFDCSCQRCSQHAGDDLMSAAAESKPPADKVKEVTAFSKESLQKIEKAGTDGDYREALKLSHECLEKQENVLADTHLLRLRVFGVATEALSHLKKFSEAAEVARRMVEGYEKLLQPNNAQLGMAMMKAGVVHWHAGQVEAGHNLICKAYRILMATHGPNHSVTKDLEAMRSQTEKELKMLKEIDAGKKQPMAASSSAEETAKGFLRKQ